MPFGTAFWGPLLPPAHRDSDFEIDSVGAMQERVAGRGRRQTKVPCAQNSSTNARETEQAGGAHKRQSQYDPPHFAQDTLLLLNYRLI